MLFDLIKDKDERINPTKTLDTEKYFKSLIIWKKNYKELHLRERPRFKRQT